MQPDQPAHDPSTQPPRSQPLTAKPAPAAPEAPPLPQLPTFTVSPYRPSGGVPPLGLLIGVLGTAIAGAILGAIASFIGQGIYLIIVFPILIGVGLGFAGLKLNRIGKIRSPLFAGIIGFLGAVAAWFSIQTFDMIRGFEQLKADDPVTYEIAMANGVTLFDFIDAMAEIGVSIGSGSSGGFNLGYVGTYVYWGLELLLMGGVAFAITRRSGKEPFCERSGNWKAPQRIAVLTTAGTLVANAVKRGDPNQLRAVAMKSSGGQTTAITAFVSPVYGFDEPIEVRVDTTTRDADGKARTETIATVTYPGDALDALREAVNFPRAPLVPKQPAQRRELKPRTLRRPR